VHEPITVWKLPWATDEPEPTGRKHPAAFSFLCVPTEAKVATEAGGRSGVGAVSTTVYNCTGGGLTGEPPRQVKT
jgi:hypothetical protein